MKQTITFIILAFAVTCSTAFTQPDSSKVLNLTVQKAEQEEDTTVYFVNQVTEEPRFKGGKAELIHFLRSNVKYPKAAELNGKQGTVMVEMMMEKDGSFAYVKTVNKPFGFGLEEEAIRVMKLSEGKWTVAKVNEKPVRIRWVYPIKFSLY